MNKPELMHQIGDAMAKDPDGWWRGFEHADKCGMFYKCYIEEDVWENLAGGREIRRRTIRIDMEVPEPMREIPQDGAEFWTIDETEKNGVCSYEWLGVIEDRMVFERGIWATEAEAKQAADAIFGALGGKHD